MGIHLARAHELRADLIAGRVTDAFADGDLAAPERRVDGLHVAQKLVHDEGDLGHVDQMRRGPLGRILVGVPDAARQRRRCGEEAGIAPHDYIDLDAAEAGVVERIAHMGKCDEARRGGKARCVVVFLQVVIDGLRHMEAVHLVARFGRLLAHDAAGVGGIVAADIEEIADVVLAAALEDLGAIGIVGLVAGGTERRRGGLCDQFDLLGRQLGQVNQIAAVLGDAAHAVTHPIDALHLAGGHKALLQTFDHAGQRLVDDGGGTAGLPDNRIAGRKIGHALPPVLLVEAAQCPGASPRCKTKLSGRAPL